MSAKNRLVSIASIPGLRALLLLLLGACSLPAASAAASNVPAAKPNIVFILFDDMGYGEPPCYRATSEFKTPNLDRLAREGMRFTDAHTAAAVCTPTRYGVLTGRYPFRIGQYGVLNTFSRPIIERQRLTVATMLEQQGYHTACFGKWHLGMEWGAKVKKAKVGPGTEAKDGPITRGFDIKSGGRELYDLAADLGESKDVAGTHPDVVERLTKLMQSYIVKGRSTPGPSLKNAVEIRLDGPPSGKKGKKKVLSAEVKAALDPFFD